MVSLNTYLVVSILLYFYMFVYNLTLLGMFWVIKSNILIRLKTIFSFNTFSFDSFHLFFLTIFLFSLAGVPPFTGFFSKLFLLNLLVENSFYIIYFMLFIILILGLYFYMQNLRFLHSTNCFDNVKPYLLNERVCLLLNYYLVSQGVFLINGVFLLDDGLLIFTWVLS